MSRDRWAIILVAMGATLLAVRGCGSNDDGSPVDPGLDAGATEGDGAATDLGFDTTNPWLDRYEADTAFESSPPDAEVYCPPQPLPDGVPQGWEEYPIFDCLHRVYVPSSTAYLPPGLEWEDCTDLGPDPYQCKQLKVDRPGEQPLFVGGIPNGYAAADIVVLQVRLAYRRADGQSAFMAFAAEADGPVRQAFWTPYYPLNGAPYWFLPRGVAPGKSAWHLPRWQGGHAVETAAMAGDDTDLRPPILLQQAADAPDVAGIDPGTYYYAETGHSARVRGWDGADFGLVASNPALPLWTGPTLLWDTDSVIIVEIWRWTEQDGSKRLVGFAPDDSRGAGNVGTDGQDLVWVQGEGRPPTGDWVFPIRSVMTAPFTTDPAQVQPRRLRSWIPEVINAGMKSPPVGCGYAAFRVVPNNDIIDLLIVRLSDGVSWTLRSPTDHRWVWGQPVVINCEEVFTTWGHGGNGHLRRIRLDSLGPGMPPD